tara:strand:- start:22 stop:198 length:177 start_codon:yes stop_codon:yes gene_type:complete
MGSNTHQKRNRKRRKPNTTNFKPSEEDFWDTICRKYNEVNHWKKKVGRPKGSKNKPKD